MPPRLRRHAAPTGGAADSADALGAPHVTVILVAHNGEPWLPETLRSLALQTRRPDSVLAVDTGSSDTTRMLLADALGEDCVFRIARRSSFPAAVAAGVQAATLTGAANEWLWLLHDDSAPERDALAHLLEAVEADPALTVVGPKTVEWDDPRRLVEVGVTTDTAGRRVTGLEPRELDQGQHDTPRDVLAIASSGLLVRADVWQQLGGFDGALRMFRDDVDFGWRANAAGHRVRVVPQARVRHAQASATGRRRAHALRVAPATTDRRHALYTVAVNTARPLLPLLVLRLLGAAIARSATFLVTRRVDAAGREMAAGFWLVRSAGRVAKGRRVRRRARVVPPQELRRLFPPRTARLRAAVDAFGGWATGGAPAGDDPAAASVLVDTSDDDDLMAPPPGRLPEFLTRPGFLALVGVALVTLLATRNLVSGPGLLSGGRLLPAPDGASDLWAQVTATWHGASGPGSSTAAPPYLAVVAALSTLLLGKAGLAVEVLLLAAVPLAAASAYVAARQVTRTPALRAWVAATWALIPVATGAVAAGRLDATVALIVLPLLLAAGARLRAGASWRAGLRPGLGLAVAAAFAPLLYPVLLVAAAVDAGLRRRVSAGLVAAFAVPPILLAPWTWRVLTDPGLLLHGPGRLSEALVDRQLSGHELLLLSPGGPGLPPWWITVPLLLAAAAGLFRRTRRPIAVAGWTLAGVGYLAALLAARISTSPHGGIDIQAWPGVALLVATAGLLLAVLAAADGARSRLAERDFGWVQLAAGIVAVLAALTPAALGLLWVVDGADNPVDRRPVTVLPAFAAADLARTPGARVLTLRPTETGPLSYDLTRGDGSRLGAAELMPDAEQQARLDEVVRNLAVARGADAGPALSTYGVRYVVVPDTPAAAALATALDAQDGLARVPFSGVRLWEVARAASRLTVLPPEAAATVTTARGPRPDAAAAPEPVSGGRIPDGPAGRLLVLRQAADDGWTARLGDTELEPATAWQWAQAFELPARGGVVTVEHRNPLRWPVLAAQLVALAVLLVVSRRRDEYEDDADLDDTASQPVVEQSEVLA